jgi:hypothetical protein
MLEEIVAQITCQKNYQCPVEQSKGFHPLHMQFLHQKYRGRHLKRYVVMSIALSYILTLSHDALTLLRSIIASIIYRSGHIGAVIVDALSL